MYEGVFRKRNLTSLLERRRFRGTKDRVSINGGRTLAGWIVPSWSTFANLGCGCSIAARSLCSGKLP